jgi:hypothetical protein
MEVRVGKKMGSQKKSKMIKGQQPEKIDCGKMLGNVK